MMMKVPTLEEALLQKIENDEGNFYQLMILAQEYNTSFGKVNRIIKRYIKSKIVTRIGYKYIIKK